MPITLTPFSHGSLCQGHAWAVASEADLAAMIARIAVGQSAHVAKILSSAGVTTPLTTTFAKKNAAAMMAVPKGGDPFHRDGWMFQTMSWIVANQVSPSSLTRAPHMILAHKGFDGLQLSIDSSTGQIDSAIVFEDKATSSPRATIRDKVWPELRSMELGEREHELIAEVTALLAKSHVDSDAAIERVIWKQVRGYRVSTTAGPSFVTAAAQTKLFMGFDKVASGSVQRRQAGILIVSDLRPWLNSLSSKVIGAIEAFDV